MSSVLKEFQDRILNDLLPEFCSDPSRSWDIEGFRSDWHKIEEVDAADFLRGLNGDLVRHSERGLYKAERSHAREQFFWSGLKRISPRPIMLWVEPIITIAVLARLHFDLGWPRHLLGTQSKDWAFDAVAYSSGDPDSEYVVCEVKKCETELKTLIDHMKRFGANSPEDQSLRPRERNALKKVQALRCSRPPLFWAVGPGNFSYAFRMEYGENGIVRFREAAPGELNYSMK